jgi:hypothetical protein
MSDITRRVADFAGLDVPVIEVTSDAAWNSHAWHALAS